MSLKSQLEQTEPNFKTKKRRKSYKWYKKFRNKWLRLFNKEEIPPIKYRRGYEY